MEIITSTCTPPHSTKSQNKRKNTINWVFISLSLTHRAWGGGGVLYKNRTEMRIALLYRGSRCPHSKGQMSIPSYKLDTIFYVGHNNRCHEAYVRIPGEKRI